MSIMSACDSVNGRRDPNLDEIREFMSAAGKVTGVDVKQTKDGRCKGFGNTITLNPKP